MTVRIGIAGWTYEPWRGVFYPPGLRQADELAYASRRLTTIEINATFYSAQKPQSFARWAATAPDGFRFSLKASRFCTYRKDLGEAGEAIDRFLGQGLIELGDRLGPILWQLMASKRFDPHEIESFLDLLPDKRDGAPLRHVIEAPHESFRDPGFADACRRRGVAVCRSDATLTAKDAEPAADFAYVRLLQAQDAVETGYTADALDALSDQLRALAAEGRAVYAYVVNQGKLRAPQAATELIARL